MAKAICKTCRGAGCLMIEGPHRNYTEPCADCSPADTGRPRDYNIVRGVPIPGDVKVIGRETKPMKYPWKVMEVGDLWECGFDAETTRGTTTASLREYVKKTPKVNFGYRLTHDKESGDRGIEVWRLNDDK